MKGKEVNRKIPKISLSQSFPPIIGIISREWRVKDISSLNAYI
jgi:hypothetical protein